LDTPISIWESLKDQIGDDESVRTVLEQIADEPETAEDILGQHGLNSAIFRTSMAIDAESHVRMQGIWQKHVTNSVSKTINLPNNATVDDVKEAFELAWETDCKAVTVYRDGSKSMQVLETGTNAADDKAGADLRTLVPRQRPKSVSGVTDLVRTGHGNMYVNINFDDAGGPFEVFTNMGKAGGCDHANLEAVSRLISLALRSGIDPDQIVEQLNGITCCPAWDGGTLIRSAPDAVAHALSNHVAGSEGTMSLKDTQSVAQLGLFPSTRPEKNQTNGTNGNTSHKNNPTGARCPRCSGSLIPQEGCLKCLDCGYSKCD